MIKTQNMVFFVLYLVFGLYFINYALNLVSLPGFFADINKWIILVGGLFVLLGGVNALRLAKYQY